MRPPLAKTSSYRVKITPKLVVPPPPLFVGVKLHVPTPLPFRRVYVSWTLKVLYEGKEYPQIYLCVYNAGKFQSSFFVVV